MIETNCLICKKLIKTVLSRIKKGQDKYCSRDCYRKSRLGDTPWNKGKRVAFETCLDCGKVRYHQGKKGLQRCRNCFSKSMKGIRPEKAIQAAIKANRGNSYRKGKKLTEESKRKISENRKGQMMGKENHKWKGDKVGYNALHTWLHRVLGQPKKCDSCETDGLTEHKIHWANKSKMYKREISDWTRLCAKCHYHFDRNVGLYG